MEKLINQNSFGWSEWRSRGIGSSDIAAILQISPWISRYELWEIKTKKREYNQSNSWTERGKRLEAKARSDYEIKFNRDMTPMLIEHDEFPFMRASLDGWNALEKRILEIKCPGPKTFELAKAGHIPDYYACQIQWQMALSGAQIADYFCFNGEQGVCIEVKPDRAFQEKMIQAAREFWMLVEKDEPPPITDKDWIEVKDALLRGSVVEWKFLNRKIKELQAQEERLREEIISKLTHPRSYYKDVRISRVERAGGFDYAQMIKDYAIEKDRYAKKSVVLYQFRVPNSDESND